MSSRIGPEFDQEWRTRFQRFGSTYEAEHAVSGWSVEGLERRFRLLRRLVHDLPLPQRSRVLELGCGAGTYVRYLAGRGHRAIGVDYAVSSLARAVERDPGRAGCYVAADGYELPFAPACFDLVLCIGVLQALGQPQRLLEETARVLRPGGIIVVEALNALVVPAVVRRLREILANRPPRLRFYLAFQVQGWLGRSDLTVLRRAGVYLPPRRFRRLGHILDRPFVTPLLDAVPGAGLLVAHAFWLVGQRSAGRPETDAQAGPQRSRS